MGAGPLLREQLNAYKTVIDDDIAAYAAYVRKITEDQYGEYAALTTDVFLDVLARGGKRIRGALVMVGYTMCGGRDQAMIVQAARAIEIFHAYILMIDDIQDRSSLRRGKPTAHEMLAGHHRRHHWRGDPQHAGISLTLNAATAGAHAAENILANLNADPQLKLNALSITNRTMVITDHGQTYDIMNELLPKPCPEFVEQILEWKTAQYSFINPLHVGMVLAGAGCKATDAITPYARHAGRAFQLCDDILGIFGDEQELGKSPMDDIREGKHTMLIFYALEHASAEDKAFLERCLGDSGLTNREFERCKKIIKSSGALEHTRRLAAQEAAAAVASLKAGKGLWSEQGTAFLRDLVETLQDRTS